MIVALTIMIIGIIVGKIIGKLNFAHLIRRTLSIALLLSVCILLFVMGLRVAGDPLIVDNFLKVGGVSFILFIFIALGTLSAVWLYAKWIDRKGDKNEKQES